MVATALHAEQPPSSQEYLLLDHVRRLERYRDGRRAVHIHLSRLCDQNRRSHRLRVANNTFENLVQRFEGHLFTLGNGDLIFVCKDAGVEEMDEAVTRLRYLFPGDPLIATEGGDQFSTWYNIETQYEEFRALAEKAYEEEQARQHRIRTRAAEWGATLNEAKPGITPAQLGRLEDFLRNTDLSSFLRRQQVCAISPDARPRRIFKELRISIEELTETTLPGVSLTMNRWLFLHFTRTLDRRLLKLLTYADDTDLHASFSVNMNVATLLSEEFLEFDSQLRTGGRGTIIIELQLIDILSDLADFAFARDFVRERGYRICIDGVTHHALPFVDRKGLGCDLVKLVWDSDLAPQDPDGASDGTQVTALRKVIAHTGDARVILGRCDGPESIRFGQELGITMYQGRFVDTLLYEEIRFGGGLLR